MARGERVSKLLAPRVEVEIADRQGTVLIRAWRYPVEGEAGAVVPVYLLDTDLPENAPDARRLTDTLYGGDDTLSLSSGGGAGDRGREDAARPGV